VCRRAWTGAGCLSTEPRLGGSLVRCCGTPAAALAREASCKMRRCREMLGLGGDDRRGEKGPYAYVPPMHPCLAFTRAPASASVLQPLAIIAGAFYGFARFVLVRARRRNTEQSVFHNKFPVARSLACSDAENEQH